MTDMRHTHLRHVDLNLLLALHVLLEERHVTRAAKRCFLSQPAMSRGLERLRERPPDLVLVDFMMPIMDGPAMLKALREDPAHRDTPAVVMSSLPESVIAEAAKGMYAAFLRKPFKLHTVVEVVNAVIDRDAATRE